MKHVPETPRSNVGGRQESSPRVQPATATSRTRRARPAPWLRRRGGDDDAGGGGVDALRRRTRASIDGLRGGRAAALRAGRRGLLSPLVQPRSESGIGVGQQGGSGGTLAPAPSDARFVSRLSESRAVRWRRGLHPNPSPDSALGETHRSRAPGQLVRLRVNPDPTQPHDPMTQVRVRRPG